MSENFQNPFLLRTPNSLQLSLPIVSHVASSLTGSVYNLSRVSAPTASSTWLLPSASGTSFQPLMGSANLYQHSSTAVLSGVTGQSQNSTSAASYPCGFKWDVTGSKEKKSSSLGDLTETVTDQNTAMSMAAQYDKASDASNMVPLCHSLSASLVQGTSSQIPNQGHSSLLLLYQQGNQVCYYYQGILGPLLSGKVGPCLKSNCSVSYIGSRASAPQPGMVMVLKEVQPADTLPPVSTSGIDYSASAPPITQPHFQVMETSLGLQPPSQSFCQPQTPEVRKTCSSRNIRTLQGNPPPEVGGISVIPIEKQDDALLSLQIPDIHQLQACTDPLGQEKQPGSENTDLGKNSLSPEDPGTLGHETESSGGFANVAALVGDSHLPQLFSSLKDLDQSKGPEVDKAKDTRVIDLNQLWEKSRNKNGSSGQARNTKYKASEPLSAAPKAKIQPQDMEGLLGGHESIRGVADHDKAPVTTSMRNQEQEQIERTRQSNSKKAAEGKQSGSRVKAEEKPTIPRMKQKKNKPQLSQENFEKPQSRLGMHMLESVQGFHTAGKKIDRRPGFSSSWVSENYRSPKHPQLSPVTKPRLNTTCEGKGPEKTHNKAQKPEGSVKKQGPSPSQDQEPRPGKFKLVPLPFLTEERPPIRRVPWRQQSLASRRPALPSSTRPGSTDAVQPTAVGSSRQGCASLTHPACSSLGPVQPNSAQLYLTNSIQPRVTQSTASRPRASSRTSHQQEPIPTAVPQHQPPPKPQTLLPPQEFCFQPRPWRKPDISGPVMSKPITEEQRPEREAMKRRAQQERENAAKKRKSIVFY
ncbi:LOW QUALITY PROTEIN: uncharacterized protein C2orf78-like [Manis pentadactyla]|uniref:LOW QUALITY PROTEIN: uncharacterized protein C2orf78-like n=1 Tax=Manis pentadactyla TaxID=143292 RepID=UPI00255CB404|nr:LOW QUALITY PROTEIN: uncharacterized protein C2orf78-like [Manis pentadactyla]